MSVSECLENVDNMQEFHISCILQLTDILENKAGYFVQMCGIHLTTKRKSQHMPYFTEDFPFVFICVEEF